MKKFVILVAFAATIGAPAMAQQFGGAAAIGAMAQPALPPPPTTTPTSGARLSGELAVAAAPTVVAAQPAAVAAQPASR